MDSIVLQALTPPTQKADPPYFKVHSDQYIATIMMMKPTLIHHHNNGLSMVHFDETLCDDHHTDEAVVQDEGHQETSLTMTNHHLQQQQQSQQHHLLQYQQLEGLLLCDDHPPPLLFGSHEPSPTDKKRRKNNNNTILPLLLSTQQKSSNNSKPKQENWTLEKTIYSTTEEEKYGCEISSSSLISSTTHNNDKSELGMNEDSNIEENTSLAGQQQQQQQQQQLYTNLRKTCNEEILLHNSNDSIIIRSYNYETDEKQVNKIFVEGIKSIVPTYLQTFYLFIHHFGIVRVFAILSLFYISSFIFQFGIIKLFFNETIVTSQQTTSLLSILLSFTNLSASSTIYAIVSTLITCTSLVVLMVCGLSKYVDYSARSYIYQQFKYSDLANIQKFYIWDEDNHFWVAQLKSTGEIVGTIGVRKRPNQEETVELKRMSVSSSMKRKGVASLMLNHLVKWSKEKGYKTIVLSTSSLQAAAVDFYKKNGFSIVKMRRYSRFLPTAHLTFEKHL